MTKQIISSCIPARAIDVEVEVWQNGHFETIVCANKAQAMKVAESYAYDVEITGWVDPSPRYMR